MRITRAMVAVNNGRSMCHGVRGVGYAVVIRSMPLGPPPREAPDSGDLDFVPIQQSEEYFTALRWLGKPARFIRYWGEGHGPGAAAANARHYWSQVLEWLERTMPPAPADPGENSTN